MTATPPRLAFCFEAQVAIGPAQTVGATAHGKRRCIPILGGTVAGPRLQGQILPGEDWQLRRTDGVTEIDARYVIEAADGALVRVRSRGLLRDGGDPLRRYSRTMLTFDAPEGPLDWLVRSLFVADLAAGEAPATVRLAVFEVL